MSSGWHMRYGRWWAVQWSLDRWLSFGVHVDTRARRTGRTGRRYGPYVDLHLGPAIVSVGVNPILSGELDLINSSSGGGLPAANA